MIARIRQAVLDHKVVFLRGQSLNYRRQVAFAERLGPLTLGHPTLASPLGQPLLEEIDSLKGGKANYWHTDVTFVDRPPAFTLLHAVVIPPVGGDTIWANTVSAYQDLPPELRELADRLRVLHTNDFDYARAFNRGERVDPALAAAHEEFVSTVYETEHPLVRVHPETSERSLLLGGFARTVLGFTAQASRDLIRLLQDASPAPSTPSAGNGARTTWPSGTTAPPSTTRSRTTAPRTGAASASPSPARCRPGWTAARASRSGATPPPTTSAAPTTERQDIMSSSAEITTPAKRPKGRYPSTSAVVGGSTERPHWSSPSSSAWSSGPPPAAAQARRHCPASPSRSARARWPARTASSRASPCWPS